MPHLPACSLLLLAANFAASLAAQQVTGDQQELGSSRPSLFEKTGRTQQFLSADAVGLPQGGTLTMNSISLRYDGPTETTTGIAHTLQNISIRVGATHRSPNAVGTVFADNLDKPLTLAFAASNYTIPTDPSNSETVQPWGASGGELHFPFARPIEIELAAGGSLVIEFAIQTNPAHLPGDTQLDFHEVAQAGHIGTSSSAGLSCGYPSMNPIVTTEGDYDIGTSFAISGSGFTPNMPVYTWATALLTPPTLLPGSFCWTYLDFNTGGFVQLNTTDATGSFGGDPPFPIPPAPGLCGSVLYLQSAGLRPPSPMNSIGIETSNYRTIRIGCRTHEPLPGWYVTRPGDASASIGSISQGGFLALRVQ